MAHGIYEHPEWYPGLHPGSSFKEFQLALYNQGAQNCSSALPCNLAELAAWPAAAQEVAPAAGPQAAPPAAGPREAPPPAGPQAQAFYMYRAQSAATYPLENINTADLAGVFWYLHNEVVSSTPRKYKVDRIKRYKVTVKNTWEFWNAHKRQFGAFVAYDAGRCSTPICKDIYHQYGFIVGCQVQPLSVANYLGRSQTNWQCERGEDACRAPIWYSLPGPCPAKGIPNGQIAANRVGLDVGSFKSPECMRRMPGGHCRAGQEADGSPGCTYSYEEAGEVFLDDLVGIGNYNEFWNTSYTDCERDRLEGRLPVSHSCPHQKEYDPQHDAGVGLSFWNGKRDKGKCVARMEKARRLFKQRFPEYPEDLPEPPCEFDMYYENEFAWDINHTGAATSTWWADRM